MAVAKLVDDERRQERRGAGELEDRLRGPPADHGRADQREHEQRHPAGSQQRSLEVKLAARCALVWSAGSSRNVASSDSATIGRLTNSTQRQPGPSASRPPRETPMAAPIAEMPPQIPSAVLRSLPSVKVVVRIESAAGAMIAAPTPWAMRAAINSPWLCASPPASEQTREPDQSGDENPPASQQVRGATAEQQETPVGEEVAAGDPLQVLLGEVQAVLNRRQRDVDDRRVGHVHELNPAQQKQRQHTQPRAQRRRLTGARLCLRRRHPGALLN